MVILSDLKSYSNLQEACFESYLVYLSELLKDNTVNELIKINSNELE